jgi:hypothetical protein
MNICVYCSASRDIDPAYTPLAETLGRLLAARGDTLVYGGASVGLMGVIATSVQAAGGHVIGIIPQALVDLEIAYHHADELVITRDMRERKGMMEARSHAFIALPGGVGTLEEIFEIINARQLRLIDKPIVLINHESFYNPLRTLLNEMHSARFVRQPVDALCEFAPDLDTAFRYIDHYASQPTST